MPEIRNSIGVPVKSETMPKGLLDAVVATLYKSNGFDVPVVEDAMPNVNVDKNGTVSSGTNPDVIKAVAGIPVKPFTYTQDGVTVTGDGNNTIPNPIKAKAEDESPEEDKKGDEKDMKNHMKEMSAVEKAFEVLKTKIAEGKSGAVNVEEINKAFAEIGTAVEKEFAPAPKAFDPNDLAAIVKSAVEDAVTPLRLELATLKAAQANSTTVSGGAVVKSKALTIGGYPTAENLIQRANLPTQPTRKLSQIEQIARKSTGADR
jgi:hypothetical protein